MTELQSHRAPNWMQLSIGLFYLSILTFAGSIGGNEVPDFDTGNNTIILLLKLMQAILVVLTFIVPVMLFSSVIRAEKLKFISLKTIPDWKHLVIALTICIVALPIVSTTAFWNANMKLPASMSGIEEWMRVKEHVANETIKLFFINNTFSNMLSNLVVVAFMAGLSEEIFFRGFIQRLFIENKLNPHLAIWITAILFSAIHLQFFGFVPRVLLGAVLGYLYHYSGNLWVPIIAHTVNNGFAVVMAYITGSFENDPLSQNGEDQVSGILILGSVLLIIGQIVYLKKLKEKPVF